MANEAKIIITWNKRTGAAKIKSPGAQDDFCQLRDIFTKDFIDEMTDQGAELQTVRITFTAKDKQNIQEQGTLGGF
ncbi:MAG: hypothetical protein GY771_08615 [bacterium]|nr:hypothetical protein [bacterium]